MAISQREEQSVFEYIFQLVSNAHYDINNKGKENLTTRINEWLDKCDGEMREFVEAIRRTSSGLTLRSYVRIMLESKDTLPTGNSLRTDMLSMLRTIKEEGYTTTEDLRSKLQWGILEKYKLNQIQDATSTGGHTRELQADQSVNGTS